MTGTAAGGRVVTLGESMALFDGAGDGPLHRGDAFRASFGGAESNVAIGLARLGVPATWIGRLGLDSFGRMIERELRAEGVTTRIRWETEVPTGLMVKHQRFAGSHAVQYYRRGSAGSRLGVEDVGDERLDDAAILHLTGITPAVSASARAAVESVLRRHPAPISLDVNYRRALWSTEEARDYLRGALAHVDLVFAGLDEAAILLGGDPSPEEGARGLAALGPGTAVVKLGADGAIAWIDGELLRGAGIRIRPVDTVGAGDAFVSGWLASTLRGDPPDVRMDVANRAGAIACLAGGDWEGYARPEDLAALDAADPVSR